MCLTHQDAQRPFFFNTWMNLKTMQRLSAWYPNKLQSVSFPPYQWNYMFFPIAKFFFFLRDLLASLIFNCSHWPSSLSSSSVYLTFPSLLRTTSTKGVFQAKKFPPKKISSATVKKWNRHRRSCKQSETYLGITGEWSTQEERETGLPKEAPAPLPQKICLWQGSIYPHSTGNHFPGEPFGHVATFQSLEKFSSNRVLRCLWRRYDFRRRICLNDFLPGLGWDFFPSILTFFGLDFYEYWIIRVF